MDAAVGERLKPIPGGQDAHSGYALKRFSCSIQMVLRRSAKGGNGGTSVGERRCPRSCYPDENGTPDSLESLLRSGRWRSPRFTRPLVPVVSDQRPSLEQFHREIVAASGQVVAIMPERQKFAAESRRVHSIRSGSNRPDNGYASRSTWRFAWVPTPRKGLLFVVGRSLPDYRAMRPGVRFRRRLSSAPSAWPARFIDPADFVDGVDRGVCSRR